MREEEEGGEPVPVGLDAGRDKEEGGEPVPVGLDADREEEECGKPVSICKNVHQLRGDVCTDPCPLRG